MGNLIYYSTANMSHENWLRFRKRGIGASEAGVVLGLSPYKSNVELYYDKIGEGLNVKPDNIAMFMGREQEDFIAKMWEYWSGSEESLIENFKNGNRVRKMRRIKAYIVNKKYPHLFASLDRIVNKNQLLPEELSDEEIVEIKSGNGTLELKTISGWESEKWEGGVPPAYVIQKHTQLLVTEWNWGELAVLKDGRFFDVLPFDKNPKIEAIILDKTLEFWNRVERSRKLLTARFEAEKSFNVRKVRELSAELQRLEPEPDGSRGLESFLKEKYRDAEPKSERSGTDEELKWAEEHLIGKRKIKEIGENILLQENRLKSSMGTVERLTFGARGSVYWKNASDGSRRFLNKIDKNL